MTQTKPQEQAKSRIDWMSCIFALLAVVTGTALWLKTGSDAVLESVQGSLWLLLKICPILIAAMWVGGYAQALIPKEFVKKWLGSESGFKGQIIASIAGALTPGGPFAAFPIILVLQRSGASFAICINFLTAWSVIGVNRILVWEIAFFDSDFILLRVIVSLPLALLAGYTTHWLYGAHELEQNKVGET
ncbi:MAG: permease [Pseudomonadales bacterium]|nr:permease [Pseudomonadales bacterium]